MAITDYRIVRLILMRFIRLVFRYLVWKARKRANHFPILPPPTRSVYYSSHGRRNRIDIFLPNASIKSKGKRLPVFINLHGGGFCLPTRGEDAQWCEFLAKRIECVVIDADYAQSPEYTWPAANEDVDSVIRWVRSEADANGWDPERISIGGFSAGGNLALVAATVGTEKSSIRSVVVFYPVTDIAEPMSKKIEDNPDAGDPKKVKESAGVLDFLYKCYLPGSTDRTLPRISPIYTDASLFPSMVTIISCPLDLLSREATALAKRLAVESSIDLVHHSVVGQGHGWDKSARDGEPSGKARDDAYELAATRLQQSNDFE